MTDSPTPALELLRPDHARAVLAFETANRAYFAASVPDRGDAFFADFEARFAQWLRWQAEGTDYFHVLLDGGGAVLGRVNLVEAEGGEAELGYRIAEHAAGRGLATSAVAAACRLAGERYGLSRLKARVTRDNPASGTVLERNGFVAVGESELDGKPAVSYVRDLSSGL